MSTDFRRGFNQKISRMDEALMQFTETQAAFCKELRDNLGGRLKKRGLELEALSDQIAALVRSSTTQISALEKIASDQVNFIILMDVTLHLPSLPYFCLMSGFFSCPLGVSSHSFLLLCFYCYLRLLLCFDFALNFKAIGKFTPMKEI